jgi:prolyl-tRNA synthetase
MFVPGDHEVNEIKYERLMPDFELLTDEEMVEFGLHKGSMGPVGLPEGAYVLADNSLKEIPRWVVGANEDGYHYVGAELGVDFKVDQWADLCVVKPGDTCPECGKILDGARGIEVAQVFQLGEKYSRAMNATYLDKDGKEQYFQMGCYGVGVSRTLAAIVEQHSDENGIIWPVSVAPAHICIIPLSNDDEVVSVAEKIATNASSLGFEVVVDDRKERPGVKFAEADLIGWPLQVIVGKRGLENGTVELKRRRTGERRDVSLDVLEESMAFVTRRMSKMSHGGTTVFSGFFPDSDVKELER